MLLLLSARLFLHTCFHFDFSFEGLLIGRDRQGYQGFLGERNREIAFYGFCLVFLDLSFLLWHTWSLRILVLARPFVYPFAFFRSLSNGWKRSVNLLFKSSRCA